MISLFKSVLMNVMALLLSRSTACASSLMTSFHFYSAKKKRHMYIDVDGCTILHHILLLVISWVNSIELMIEHYLKRE